MRRSFSYGVALLAFLLSSLPFRGAIAQAVDARPVDRLTVPEVRNPVERVAQNYGEGGRFWLQLGLMGGGEGRVFAGQTALNVSMIQSAFLDVYTGVHIVAGAWGNFCDCHDDDVLWVGGGMNLGVRFHGRSTRGLYGTLEWSPAYMVYPTDARFIWGQGRVSVGRMFSRFGLNAGFRTGFYPTREDAFRGSYRTSGILLLAADLSMALRF